uniref:Ribosomal protein S19 n=1 Tax=Paraurostyla sp. TaxID=6014 RepID=A0A3S6K1X7_9STIC|nr:ribosomal protein S19 [Paraurostyla sp.]
MLNMNFTKKLNKNKKIQKTQNNNFIFCAPAIWRKIFLIKKSFVFKLAEKLVYSRCSVLPKTFNNSYFSTYSGKRWNERISNKWMVGFKFGEFTWNRKMALYKAKQLKKKKKLKK